MYGTDIILFISLGKRSEMAVYRTPCEMSRSITSGSQTINNKILV